jgi:hypothetical protein
MVVIKMIFPFNCIWDFYNCLLLDMGLNYPYYTLEYR